MPDKKTVDADIEVVQPQKANTSKTQPNPGTGPEKSQSSWVWVHFKVHKDKHVQCQVATKKTGGDTCLTLLKIDDTGSTKSMIEHLQRIHGLVQPKNEKTNQLLLPNLKKRQRIKQRTYSSRPLHI
ncbi:hypothetical protein KEM48_005769 [Puccinia striiformis f. sp. tritici PST-130]|uniref:BED-type domain-containing protein n=2 Tax=Puccinia striiformis TaxID=27350 RepID=A0A0L0UV68_9BASI|nr:hypothetical protein KEM48_005769 [Puccinia striiformis f. sp. tritici PST-130]KNE90928.1 hypothetical protein PSTG_15623 [Puccinia striiformis f. sp. tritici PST-78]POW17255.1 hypothetical protein PSTT_00524 [Puccinia striiformis]